MCPQLMAVVTAPVGGVWVCGAGFEGQRLWGGAGSSRGEYPGGWSVTFIARFGGRRGPAWGDLLWERPAAQPPSLLRAPPARSAPLCRRVQPLKGPGGPAAGPRGLEDSAGAGRRQVGARASLGPPRAIAPVVGFDEFLGTHLERRAGHHAVVFVLTLLFVCEGRWGGIQVPTSGSIVSS